MKIQRRSIASVAAVGFFCAQRAFATTFDIVGKPRSSVRNVLSKRKVDIGAYGNGSEVLENGSDTIYACNVTLGGSEFEVLIDTGSSDLWVTGDVPGTKNLSIAAGVNYAAGSAKGFINTAELGLGDYTVKDQAYINVVEIDQGPGTQGIIGFGPSSASQVVGLVKDNSVNDAPPLDRIFQQNKSTPNFLTVYLSRESDSLEGGTAAQSGQITIGSIIPEYQDISKQPKLPGLKDQFGIQHWQTLLDANGIIGPDGQNITTKTSIQNPDQGSDDQFHVVFDTGFTFPQMTQDVADAIYGRVPGAKFVTQQSSPGYWRIPCDYELNISFVFNNVKIPIHPLDLSMPETDKSDEKNCMSTFQQISPSTANHKSFGAFDVILGMAFLRNTYLLIDFGDFVEGSDSNTADPYIQLLSITDPGQAHTDFVNDRLGGTDTSGSQQALVSESEAQHSPDVSDKSVNQAFDNDNDDDDKPWYKTWRLYAVIGAAAGGLALILAAILTKVCRTRRSNVRKEAAFVPQMAGAGAYAPLRDSGAYGHGRSMSEDPWRPPAGYEEPHYQYGGRGV